MPSLRDLTIYIGIDPGKNGGLVILDYSGSVSFHSRMPRTERDIWIWFSKRVSLKAARNAVIEKVGGYVRGSKSPGSAMFNFGWGYGGLRMALVGHGIPFEEVTPQRWQRAMGIASRKKNESKTAFKNRLKAKAQQLFPTINVTHATADALLIAEYCRRKNRGLLG
jgi:hypothetical protein